MKKLCTLLLLLCPLLSIAQLKPDLFAGISLNNTVSTITSSNNQFAPQSSTYVFPEVHFGANIYAQKLNKIFFRLEATASYNIASYTATGSSSPAYLYTGKIKDVVVGVNPQLLYAFNKTGAGSFYAGVGFAGYAISSSLISAQYTTYASSTGSYSGSETDSSSIIALAATAKVGYTISKKLDIYLGYNAQLASTNSTQYVSYNSPTYISDQSVYKLGINYRLSKR